jgi:hypothetical protein
MSLQSAPRAQPIVSRSALRGRERRRGPAAADSDSGGEDVALLSLYGRTSTSARHSFALPGVASARRALRDHDSRDDDD